MIDPASNNPQEEVSESSNEADNKQEVGSDGQSFNHNKLFSNNANASINEIKRLLRPKSTAINSNDDAKNDDAKDDSASINYSQNESLSQLKSFIKSEINSDKLGSQNANQSTSVFARSGCMLVIVLIALLVMIRIFQINPFKSSSQISIFSEMFKPQNSNVRGLILLAVNDAVSQFKASSDTTSSKLFYYDRFNEAIYEVNTSSLNASTSVVVRRTSGIIPSVDKIALSHDEQKVCIISSSVNDKKGLYILNFSRVEMDDFIQQWSLSLPSGFTIEGNSSASWSPDSTTVAFTASKNSQIDLFVAKSEKDVQRVTYIGKNIGTITWLDDQRLAFVSDWEGKDQIYTIKSDGGDLRLLQR